MYYAWRNSALSSVSYLTLAAFLFIYLLKMYRNWPPLEPVGPPVRFRRLIYSMVPCVIACCDETDKSVTQSTDFVILI